MADKEYAQEQKRLRAERKKARKRKLKRILLVVEALLILVLAAGAYVVAKFDKLDITPIDVEEEISVNEEVKENETLKEYTNIALFGIDSRDESLSDGNRSDTMMIASINNKTHEIKLVSVYRDSYLLIPREENAYYDKANLAYFYGGPKMSINLMNVNLDLDITDYVAVNFSA
ncbi:MAG: LCP family protein, partial [Lachnospiraceae bacterium]|nr:LCP family protein [Lachnospiraceae bacterium]